MQLGRRGDTAELHAFILLYDAFFALGAQAGVYAAQKPPHELSIRMATPVTLSTVHTNRSNRVNQHPSITCII